MSRLNRDGVRVRTPRDRVTYWSQRREAQLDTVLSRPVSYRIGAADKASATEIVIKHSGITTPLKGGRRFAVNWVLEQYEGQEDDLQATTGGLVTVNGFKPRAEGSEEPRPKAFHDLVFLGGEVELMVLGEEMPAFNLGRVASLGIIAPDDVYVVWPVGVPQSEIQNDRP